jgi:tRNA modification GTPase
LIKENPNKKVIIVLNKLDLENRFDKSLLGYFSDYIELSTKENINPLIKKIEKVLDENSFGDDITLVSKRQIIAVQNTLDNINLSKEPLKNGELEFFAHFVTQALEEISSITRPYENDQMLDIMFSSFCLGK